MKIGVLAYQGSFEEHALQVKRALTNLKLSGEVIPVKKVSELEVVDGIIIPGGESTTIGIVAQKFGLLEPLRDKIMEGLPVLGTCAGAIMLAKDVTDAKVGKKSQPLIGVMDIEVVRNYYGRQRESFEAPIDFGKIGGKINKIVFIRAPAITKIWGNAKSLAEFNGTYVMVEENNMLATTFHPELSGSTVIHEHFLSLIKK